MDQRVPRYMQKDDRFDLYFDPSTGRAELFPTCSIDKRIWEFISSRIDSEFRGAPNIETTRKIVAKTITHELDVFAEWGLAPRRDERVKEYIGDWMK